MGGEIAEAKPRPIASEASPSGGKRSASPSSYPLGWRSEARGSGSGANLIKKDKNVVLIYDKDNRCKVRLEACLQSRTNRKTLRSILRRVFWTHRLVLGVLEV